MLNPVLGLSGNRLAMSLICVFVVTAMPVTAATSTRPESTIHEKQVMEWRANRDAGLRSEHGWLSLVGLEWLQQGVNTLGSAVDNSAQIPGGPSRWGVIELTGDQMLFKPQPGSGVLVDGEEVGEVQLLADNSNAPSVISFGSMNIQVIFRESYGLRISDSQAPARLNFQGIDNYQVQAEWLVNGRFEAAEKGTTIEIGNVLGQLLQMPVFGYFEFESEGKTHRLAGIGEADSENLWFIFADRTSGRETYGAGRFLYSESMPENSRLMVDFNKAYNPPCAFNDYSTCPLPPLENRLDLHVTAGEKNYHAITE